MLVVPETVALNCLLWPAAKVALEGLTLMEIAAAGVTVTTEVFVTPPALALTVTDEVAVAVPTCTAKFALVAPAETVTAEGIVTLAPPVTVLPRDTETPPAGAAFSSVAVQVDVAGPWTVDGLQERLFTLG